LTNPNPSVVNLLIVADTHGQLDPRIAALAGQVDMVVHAGDVGSAWVLETLAGAQRTVVAVRGNNDTPKHWGESGREQLDALRDEAHLELPGGVLVVTHGDVVLPAAKRHQRLRARYPAARLVVFGHSHRLGVDREARPWVANPGAAGRVRTYGGPSCLLLEATASNWRLESRRFELLPLRR